MQVFTFSMAVLLALVNLADAAPQCPGRGCSGGGSGGGRGRQGGFGGGNGAVLRVLIEIIYCSKGNLNLHCIK